MIFSIKQNVFAVFFAGLLSFWIYKFILTNPNFLTADIHGAINLQKDWDIRYHIIDNKLVIQAGKNFNHVVSMSALLSFDPTKVSLQKESIKSLGNANIAYEDWSAQVTLILQKNFIRIWDELFRMELWWSDISQVVVNDIMITFSDWTSDVVSVGVEN